MEISQLKELLEAFDKSSAAVLEVHEGNLSIYLEKDASGNADSLPPFPVPLLSSQKAQKIWPSKKAQNRLNNQPDSQR